MSHLEVECALQQLLVHWDIPCLSYSNCLSSRIEEGAGTSPSHSRTTKGNAKERTIPTPSQYRNQRTQSVSCAASELSKDSTTQPTLFIRSNIQPQTNHPAKARKRHMASLSPERLPSLELDWITNPAVLVGITTLTRSHC